MSCVSHLSVVNRFWIILPIYKVTHDSTAVAYENTVALIYIAFWIKKGDGQNIHFIEHLTSFAQDAGIGLSRISTSSPLAINEIHRECLVSVGHSWSSSTPAEGVYCCGISPRLKLAIQGMVRQWRDNNIHAHIRLVNGNFLMISAPWSKGGSFRDQGYRLKIGDATIARIGYSNCMSVSVSKSRRRWA